MKRRSGLTTTTLALGALVGALVLPASSFAAAPQGPPPPTAANGNAVSLFASGVAIPTQFAFAGKNTFIAGGSEGPAKGGIYVVKPGSRKAVKIKGSPGNAFGVLYKGKTLYASLGKSIVAYTKWNGKRFNKQRTVVKGPKKFTGFNGLGLGPDGRLYAGTIVDQAFDHKNNPGAKYANSVISVKKNGKDLKVVSKGIRQPWQMVFAKGEKSPIVSVLGPDGGPAAATSPDLLIKAKPKSNFGFASCTWAATQDCKGFTKPLRKFAPVPNSEGGTSQPSPMGLAVKGKKLYVALFNGLGTGPEIVTTGTKGGALKPFMTGYVAPVLSVAVHNGYVYTGDLTGTIYRVKE